MLKVRLTDGQLGTVQGYVAVAHEIIAIVLVDTHLVSAYLRDLTAERTNDGTKEFTGGVGRSGPTRDSSNNSRADGRADNAASRGKGAIR